MLDPALELVIRQVVADKVTSGDMFTAFDVSLDVKSKGHRERHNNMKHVVHEEYVNGRMNGYNRTLIPVVPGFPEAWVYHLHSDDPTTYSPQNRKVTAPPKSMSVKDFYAQSGGSVDDGTTTPPVVSAPPVGLVAVASPSKYARKGDGRGCLCVPAVLLRKIGVKPKDKVFVQPGTNCAVLNSTISSGKVFKYTVDVNNNVRVTAKALDYCGVHNTSRYDFEINGSQIVIKVAA